MMGMSRPGVKLTLGEGNEEGIYTYSEAFKVQVVEEIRQGGLYPVRYTQLSGVP